MANSIVSADCCGSSQASTSRKTNILELSWQDAASVFIIHNCLIYFLTMEVPHLWKTVAIELPNAHQLDDHVLDTTLIHQMK